MKFGKKTAAVVLLFLGREQRAITLAVFAVTLWLTTVALLTFYLDQFGAMYGALLQFASLMILLTYQRWYLEELPSAAATAPQSLAVVSSWTARSAARLWAA